MWHRSLNYAAGVIVKRCNRAFVWYYSSYSAIARRPGVVCHPLSICCNLQERYKSTLTNSNDPRLEGLPASRMQVACFQDLTRTLRASVAQKSFACIRQHDLSGFVHRCPRRHLRASVSETTLACIHFQGSLDTNMCIRTSETLVLTTGFLHLEISPLFPDLKMNSI